VLALYLRTVEERIFLSSHENPQFEPAPLSSEAQTPVPLVADPFPPAPLPAPPAPKAGENPVWSGWDVLQLAGLTLLTLFLTQLLIVVGARRFAFPHESWLQVAQKPYLALLAELLTYLAIALYMILLVEGKYHARFWQAIRWNWPGISGVSFIGVGVLMLGLDVLGRFLPMPKSTPFDQFFERPMDAYLVAAFAVTLGPLMEELFFRGFLYPVLARRAGAVWGILITGLLFGLIHSPQYGYSWAAVLIVCLVGVVFTTVRAVTKSVGSSFLAHVGYNATLMVLAAVATDGFRHMDKAGVMLFCF
jgi:membrane protease YdiL (CAAX protease family)